MYEFNLFYFLIVALLNENDLECLLLIFKYEFESCE